MHISLRILQNVTAHLVTGKEIYDDMDGKVDIFVAAAGSGGSITGAAKYLKQKIKNIKIVLADPVGSVIGGGPKEISRLKASAIILCQRYLTALLWMRLKRFP